MTSNWYAGVCGSQSFNLRLSEGSSTNDSASERFVTNEKAKDDIIVISDSSCSSSPVRTDKPKSSSTSNVRNKEYRKLHFVDISSSESERESESDSSWKLLRIDDKFLKKTSTNRTVVQETPETSLISNDTLSTAERLFDSLIPKCASTNNETAVTSNMNCDRDQVNKSSNDRNVTLITEQEKKSKLREECNFENINRVIKPSHSMYSDSSNVLRRYPITPKQDSTGKTRLTKKDTYNILKNIKCTQIEYNSAREKKEVNAVINESTDTDDEIIHPAISSNYNKKVQHPSDSPDVIDTSLKNNILQEDLSESSKPHINISKVMDSFKPLSERRKRQIKEWLLTNFSDSQSDSSFNTVPPSTRNSNSGNSSLERLEMNYETPNNRERIKAQTDEKQRTIINSDKVVQSTDQNTLVKYFKKTKPNSECRTPDNKPNLLSQTDKKVSSVTNTFDTKDVRDFVDISDKLYNTPQRALPLFSTTEPRKTSVRTVNRIVQTERKPVSKSQYCVTDLDDSDDSDLVENIKSNRRRNIQRKQKEMDSFINDESLSSNDSESIYHSALTNPTTFTSNSTKSVPASIKRLQALCDTDTDDEDDKSSNNPKNLRGTKLSFSDDESSSTSEFDPGDYVPPKYIPNKEILKKPISSKAPKFESTITKFVGYKTFLASLSKTVPMSQAHPDAKKYRLDYKNNKEKLCKKLYKLYNEKVFDNKLPQDMSIEWNIRMRGTAGYCYNKKSVNNFGGNVLRSSRIVLATKILDTPDRLRDTLIHEMCHAASWIIDNISDGHGFFWTKRANEAMKIFPELPPIRRCHNYEIKTKFTYKCTSCGYSIGRHSKSLDIEKKRCGYCYGKFELLINKTTKSGTVQVQTPKREPTGFALYVKQNYNSVKKEKSNMKHGDVMKLLGQQFSAIKITKKTDIAGN